MYTKAQSDCAVAKGFRLSIALTTIISILAIHAVPAQELEYKNRVSTGIWGGEHIGMRVLESGATIEYDCAFGSISVPLFHDEQGRFEVRGVHIFETGGPARQGDPKPKKHSALYRGRLLGNEMSLSVTLPDTDRYIGDFTLHYGSPALLEKCL